MAAGHSALAEREQREVSTLALFTSYSVGAASHGMVPPVSWEGLPFSGKSFRHPEMSRHSKSRQADIQDPLSILRSVGCGETIRCTGLWTSVGICVEIKNR